MKLSTILKQQARYAQASGLVVDIDRAYQTVSLHDDIFMQGDEAQGFIDAVDTLSKSCRSLSSDIVELAVAYPYADLLEGLSS